VGVPAMVVSAGVVTGGIGNMAAGVHGLSAALMMKGETVVVHRQARESRI
jgi:hypothetical protein